MGLRNPQTHRICGLLPENGPPSFEQALHCYHPEDRPKVQRAVQTAMERGEAFEFQHRIVRPSGEVRMVHVRGLAHPDPHGDGAEQLFGVIIDVTDLEQVRARLAQAERMVSLGTLAAGVAHEINNPLSFVATNAEMAAELAACDRRDAELVHMLSDIRDGAERIRQIAKALARRLRPHRVTACTDARQALERIGDSAHFDLVLCDLMMPSMTGAEFLQALRQMRPDLAQRTVFMSGGAFTPAMREFLAREQPRLFDKPLDVPALLRRIESL